MAVYCLYKTKRKQFSFKINKVKILAGIKNDLLSILGRSNVKPSQSLFPSPFLFFRQQQQKNSFKNLLNTAGRRKETREEKKGYSPNFLRSLIQSYESYRKRRNNIFIHLEKSKQTQKRKGTWTQSNSILFLDQQLESKRMLSPL